MILTSKQVGVLKGMVFGAISAIVILLLGSTLEWVSLDHSNDLARIKFAMTSVLFPALFLLLSIARLARHRFFTPEDIDGSALSEGTEQAKLLQSLLQNTLEQLSLAVIAYLAWAVVMPAQCLSVIPLAAIAFSLGRILFFVGYKKGAASRAAGFALTFYPTCFMLISMLGYLVWLQVS